MSRHNFSFDRRMFSGNIWIQAATGAIPETKYGVLLVTNIQKIFSINKFSVICWSFRQPILKRPKMPSLDWNQSYSQTSIWIKVTDLGISWMPSSVPFFVPNLVGLSNWGGFTRYRD